MSPRHAAALALVGWYLMLPPFAASGKSLDLDVPLGEWSKIGPAIWMNPKNTRAVATDLSAASRPAADDPFTGGPVEADSLAGVHYGPFNGFCLPGPGMPDFTTHDCVLGLESLPLQIVIDIRSSVTECAHLFSKSVVVDDSVPATFEFNVPRQGVEMGEWCGNFDAQLRAAGYVPVKDRSNPKLFRIVPVAQAND